MRQATTYHPKTNDRISAEHHQWVIERWVKIDRDHDGFLNRKEIDSRYFRDALFEAVGGDLRQHVKMNLEGLVDWVRRKCDYNGDGLISFAEFEAFTGYLRSLKDGGQQDSSRSMAEVIFAMFDLNGDDSIDIEEFREIYRFFHGEKPKEDVFQAEWASLDAMGDQFIRKERYVQWLKERHPNLSLDLDQKGHHGGRSSPKPQGKAKSPQGTAPASQKLPTIDGADTGVGQAKSPVDDPERYQAPGPNTWRNELAGVDQGPRPGSRSGGGARARSAGGTMRSSKGMSRSASEAGFRRSPSPAEVKPWNRRHHVAGGPGNESKPQGQREYFSRPQSLPELQRYYEGMSHVPMFDSLNQALMVEEVKGVSMTLPRHKPGGEMKNRAGDNRPWNDRWNMSVSSRNQDLHPLHREYFDTPSLFSVSPSQKWRRMQEVQLLNGEWARTTYD